MNQKLFWTLFFVVIVSAGGYYWYANYYRADNYNNHNDLIRVTSPRANEMVTSPLVVTGEARGNWYFEAFFPVYLLDTNDQKLAKTIARAKDDWMTTDFVLFEATLIFDTPTTATGFLILTKNNPSRLTENDDEIRIPIKFGVTKKLTDCKPTGCNGQICSDEEIASTCEYNDEYVCYKNAHCKRQVNGQCSWVQTKELKNCLGTKQQLTPPQLFF